MSQKATKNPDLRDLPKVDVLLGTQPFADLITQFGRVLVTTETRAALEDLRERLKSGAQVSPEELDKAALLEAVNKRVTKLMLPKLCRVINATGVILHTSLGRAPLAERAVESAMREASGYSLLELDRESGKRSDRDKLVSSLICRLTGAEAATVVNNNAAATMIVLNSLAEGHEVVCSRAHMVEIGGSYRMPDVMRKAGVTLREVGCTNKTRAQDFEDASGPNTAMLMKVHTSNYAIVGFTEEPELAELVSLGKKLKLPVFYDLGSGSMVDLAKFGLTREPCVPDLMKSGVDVLCISGDKLFGGPQAGMIMGSKDLIEKIKRNALFRMVRCDKVTLALLEATLRLYLKPENVFERVPTLRAIARTEDDVKAEASKIAATLDQLGIDASIAQAQSQIGGGSTPGEYLPTTVVIVRGLGRSPDAAATLLRRNTPSVFCRIEYDALVFDPRSLLPGQAEELVAAIGAIKQ
ncbi:MAG: L-seryl-tRNA(Sec) selenium transferase [Planctomycetes bacterium]|nr:L-seryl-tRNA(Sec) selenium transferase [Planctomycetota bacterium]